MSMMFTNVKAYRNALYTYQMNTVNAISFLLNQLLPMSLVTQDSLMVILVEVGAEPAESNDHLTLAMPIEIIFYYESKLLNYVITTYEGLVMQLAFPLASRKTAFAVYEAKPVPMPQSSQNTALRWKLEQLFLAVSEDSMKEAALDRFHLQICIGSDRYQLSHESTATKHRNFSCLSSQFCKTSIDAIKVCDTEEYLLPSTETAKNLGLEFGSSQQQTANTLPAKPQLIHRSQDLDKYFQAAKFV